MPRIAFSSWPVLERSTTRVSRVWLYSPVVPDITSSSKRTQKIWTRRYWVSVTNNFLGPGRYWNDQPHACHGSGCIPLLRQFHECYCVRSGYIPLSVGMAYPFVTPVPWALGRYDSYTLYPDGSLVGTIHPPGLAFEVNDNQDLLPMDNLLFLSSRNQKCSGAWFV